MLGNWLNQLRYSVAGDGGRECGEIRKKQLDGTWEYIRLNAKLKIEKIGYHQQDITVKQWFHAYIPGDYPSSELLRPYSNSL